MTKEIQILAMVRSTRKLLADSPGLPLNPLYLLPGLDRKPFFTTSLLEVFFFLIPNKKK